MKKICAHYIMAPGEKYVLFSRFSCPGKEIVSSDSKTVS